MSDGGRTHGHRPTRRDLVAALLFGVAGLAGCQAPGARRAVPVPGQHRLAVGEVVRLPDASQLGYVRLVTDSRCRPGVQCIWAGKAEIELRWQPATGDAVVTTLDSDARSRRQTARFGPWQVRLQALDWNLPPAATLDITRAP